MLKKTQQKLLALKDISVIQRAREEMGEIDELAASIHEHGLIQPIAVMEPKSKGGKYRLLAGGRRIAAVKHLGWNEIQCNIYSSQLTNKDTAAIELAENIDRMELSWDEKVILKRRIHGKLKETQGERHAQKDTAAFLKESPSKVSLDLELASAIESVPELRKAKSADDARKMLRTIQESIIAEELARRQTEEKDKDPKREKLLVSYHHGDFLKAKLKPNYYDLVDFDPEYLNLDLAAIRRDSPIVGFGSPGVKEYTAFVGPALKKCYDAMKESSWLILWMSIQSMDINKTLLGKAGFDINQVPAIWLTRNHDCRNPKINMANSYDCFLYARKGKAELKKARLNCYEYRIVSHAERTHQAEAPIEMMEDIISTFCLPGSNVLVPCAGSGNTMIAAYNYGCANYDGWDTVASFRDNFIVRVKKGKLTSYGNDEAVDNG